MSASDQANFLFDKLENSKAGFSSILLQQVNPLVDMTSLDFSIFESEITLPTITFDFEFHSFDDVTSGSSASLPALSEIYNLVTEDLNILTELKHSIAIALDHCPISELYEMNAALVLGTNAMNSYFTVYSDISTTFHSSLNDFSSQIADFELLFNQNDFSNLGTDLVTFLSLI